MPCKHTCAVIQSPGVGWEALGARFSTHPLYILDPAVLAVSNSEKQSSEVNHVNTDQPPRNQQNISDDSEPNASSNNDILGGIETGSTEIATKLAISKCHGLPTRRLNKSRRRCISALKFLQDDLYVLKDQQVLDEIHKGLKHYIQIAARHKPKENNLPLKDKSLSPRKNGRKSKNLNN